MTTRVKERRGLLSWVRSGLKASHADDEVARLTEDDDAEGMARLEDRGEIARGGMGSVRKVFDRTLLRTLAMKVLDPQVKDPRLLRRFREEAQIAGQLEHPNIAPVHEYGIDHEKTRYFTMKWVRGKNLKELLDEHPPEERDIEERRRLLDVLLRVMDAVSFAHSRGVIHRDIKPENIMVGEYGQVYLMDFGLAKLKGHARALDGADLVQVTKGDVSDPEGMVLGTLGYLSPEQAYGHMHEMDERTDVFGLGATLYEILAGHPPYQGELAIDLVMKARRRELVPLDEMPRVPTALARVAMRALCEDPDDRYQSVAEMRAELEQLLRGGWHFPTRDFPAGVAIVTEGEEGDEAFILVRGRCLAWRDGKGGRISLGELGPGDVFGEAAALSLERRTATVEALEPVTCLVVTRAALEEELSLESWAGPFIKALARRFVDMNARLKALEGAVSDDNNG